MIFGKRCIDHKYWTKVLIVYCLDRFFDGFCKKFLDLREDKIICYTDVYRFFIFIDGKMRGLFRLLLISHTNLSLKAMLSMTRSISSVLRHCGTMGL